jgi:hypothetical protein
MLKSTIGLFVVMGACDTAKAIADDRALESLVHSAPATGNVLYENDIEAPMVESTLAYYVEKGQRWMSQLAMPEYLAKVPHLPSSLPPHSSSPCSSYSHEAYTLVDRVAVDAVSMSVAFPSCWCCRSRRCWRRSHSECSR